MPRTQFRHIVTVRGSVSSDLIAVENAHATLTNVSDGDPPTMWDSSNGGSPLTNPLVSNDQGEVMAWIDADLPGFIHVIVDDNAGEAFRAGQPGRLVSFATYSETVATIGIPTASMTPRVRRKSDANITMPAVGGTWKDIDPSGTATARDLDVVLDTVAEGDWISFQPNFVVGSSGSAALFDVMTIVAAAPVHQFSGLNGVLGNTAFPAWTASASLGATIVGEFDYQVQADDIDNGTVRLRMQIIQVSGTPRLLLSSAGFVATWRGRGPF